MERVTYQIKDINHEIIRYICETVPMQKKMPTPAQMQILHFIISKKGQKVYQKDIALALNLRRATLSEILSTMEKNNLIHRFQDKTDTRKKEIIISKEAQKNFQIVKKALNQAEKTITKNISEEHINLFFQITNQMKENLKNERMKIC